MARGYTRRQLARRAGCSMRTVDKYRLEKTISGVLQYVEGHGIMRLFTDEEVSKVRARIKVERSRQPAGIRRYSNPPPRRRLQ